MDGLGEAGWATSGRGDVLAQAQQALRRADRPRQVLLTGPAGIGKTTVARHLAEAAGDAEWIFALPGAEEVALAALTSLHAGEDEASARPAALGDAIARATSRLLDSSKLLIIDDLPRLDDASLVVIGQVLARSARPIVLTARTPPLLSDTVAELVRDITRIDLQPLGPLVVRDLVESALGGVASIGLLTELERLSDGNPLHLRELLEAARHDGAVQHEAGEWRLAGSLSPPGRVQEAVRRRLDGLDDTSRRAVELLALGEPLTLPHADALLGSATLRTLEQAHLIAVDPADRVWLAHPLYGEVLRAAIGRLAARQLQLELADALPESAAPDEVMRGVGWRLAAGAAVEVESLLQAVPLALRRFELDLAERAARAARGQEPGLRTTLALGEVLAVRRDLHEAVEVFAELAGTLSDPDDIVSLTLSHAYTLFHGLGRRTEALEVTKAAESRLTDPLRQARIRTYRAGLRIFDGQPEEALADLAPLLAQAIAAADDATLPGPQATSLLVEAGVLALTCGTLTGSFASNADLRARLDAVAARAPEDSPAHVVFNPYIAAITQVSDLASAGRLAELRQIATEGEAAAEAHGSTYGAAWLASFLGEAALLEGDVGTAQRCFRRAIDRMTTSGADPAVVVPGAGLVQALALAGRLDLASQALRRTESLAAGGYASFNGGLDRARAWLAVLNGSTSEGVAVLRAAADTYEKMTVRVLEAAVLHDLVRLDAATADDVQRLADLAGSVEGALSAARAAHAAAWLDGSVDALEAAGGEFAAMGANLLAAECLAQAARAARRGRDQRAVTGLTKRARALSDLRTPALATLTAPPRLSVREAEVAALAAEGLTSTEIGERLSLSARTVDNHLGKVFRKLGVSRRDEIGAALQGR